MQARRLCGGSVVSGPKGIEYEVISEAERLRRELTAMYAQVSARYSALLVLRAAAGAAVTDLMPAPRPAAAGAGMAEMRLLEADIVSQEKQLGTAITQARTSAGRAAVQRQLEGLTISLPAAPDRPERLRAASDPSPAASTPELEYRLMRVIEVAASLSDEQLTEDLGQLSRQAAGSTSAAATGAVLTEMEARLTRALHLERRQQAARRQAREMSYRFADLARAEPAASELVAELARVADMASVDDLTRKLNAVGERRTAQQDRRFAVEQSAAVLREMGYAVDIGELEADSGTVAMTASSARWPNHGLQLVFRGEQQKVHTTPIAFSETDPRDDVAFEQASCEDIQDLRTTLAERGLHTDLVHHVKPGALTVQRRTAPARLRSAHRGKERRR